MLKHFPPVHLFCYRIIAEKFGLTLPTSEIFSPQVKNAYKNLLKDHYASVTKYLLKKHKELQKLERQNMRMLQVGEGLYTLCLLELI